MDTNHSDMETPEIGKAGGQEFSIVRSIKTFLEQMAEGSAKPAPTVLKELLQNADDAGATEIEITLDARVLPKQWTPYDLLLEPSLLVRNNAIFKSKEELEHRDKGDFEALLDVAGGHKTSDSVAAGRFGIGFNSVYFLTDNPVIFSRDEIHFLDLLHHFPFKGKNGWIFTLEEFPAEYGKSAGAIKNIIEICFPKTVLIQDTIGEMAHKKAMYKQSVFRLPIRTKHQASETLSDLTFKNEDIKNLFNEMIDEAPRSLLFLKTLNRIIFSRLDTTDKKTTVAEISITPNPPEFGEFLSYLQEEKDYTTEAIQRVIQVKIDGADQNLPFKIWHRIDFTNPTLADNRKLLEGSDKAVPWVSIAVPGSKEAMTIDGNSNPNWRVFLPLLEEGPCGCLFSGAFFVGPSRQRLDYKTDEGILKTKWNQTLVREALVPLFCEKSIEIPEVAESILANDPKAYLSLFPGKVRNKEAKNLSDYTQTCFQTTENIWFVRVPDLWGNEIDIWKGSQEFTIERVPEWLFKYKQCFEHLSNPNRRFVTESLGRALADRSDVQEYSPDIIEAVLRDKDAIDVVDLDKLWSRYAKNVDNTTSQNLNGLLAFTDYDSGALIEYDDEKLFIVVPKNFSDPVFSLVKSLKAGFSDVCWISETGLANETKNFSDLQNIHRPSHSTILELLRRIDIDDHKAIELKNNDLEILIDFLVERKTAELVDLKLGFLIKIASNKEKFASRKSVFIRTTSPTKDDDAFWNVWFKSHFSELDPHVAKQIRRLINAHPHIIDMIKTSQISLVEATSSHGIDILIKAIMADKSLIEELATSINSPKEKANARRVSEYIIERAMNQWNDWDEEKQNYILDLPIHRAVDGKYISLKADEVYWLQSRDSADLDAPITLKDRPILNPQSQFVNEFYANTLKIEYNGRLSIIKQALKQIGLDNVDNQALLAYIVKYYQSVIDTYPDEVSELKELLLAANIVLCSDGEWRPLTEAYNPARVIDILCEQGWEAAEAHQVVKSVCSDIPIIEQRIFPILRPLLLSQYIEIPALTRKQFSKSIVTSESLILSIQQIIKLVTNNPYNDEFEISDLIQQSDLPTITGSSKLCEAKLLINRVNLSDRLLGRLIPNLVDVPKLSDSIGGITQKDVQDALKYLRVDEITSDSITQKLISQFAELWDTTKTKDDKFELLVFIEDQDAFDDLRDVISTIPIIQTQAKKETWAEPTEALTPDLASLNPPLISETELPSNDVPDKIIALYRKICGINSFSLVFPQILCRLASGNKSTRISEVYNWLSSLLDTKRISTDELTDCLKTNKWVLANKGGTENYLMPKEVLICDASSILKHHFSVPALPIPDNLIKLDMGFLRSLPETPDDLRGVCQAILESSTTDEASYIALYKMIAKLLTVDELKKIWLEEASNNPLILTFREKNRFSRLYGLFIGNDEYNDDLTSNLLCLKNTELSKIVENLYLKLGVETLPSIRHLYYAISEFEERGDPKEYRKLVDLVTKFVDTDISEGSIKLDRLKVKTLAGTYKEISRCYNAPLLITSGSVNEGQGALIDINDASTRKLVDWIQKIEPYCLKELRYAADYSIQSQDDPDLLQHYEAVLDAWVQLLSDLNREDSLLIEKFNDQNIGIEPIEIRIKTATNIEINAIAGNTKVKIKSNDQNWFCSSERNSGIIIIKPSPAIDYNFIDTAITEELLSQLRIDTAKDEYKSAISVLQEYLERPSSTLRRISKEKQEDLLSLYKNEVADPEFNEKFERYRTSAKKVQKRLKDELLSIASGNYLNERRKTILGHGYDKNSIIAELLQNAEDAYKQANLLGMEIPEVPYFSILVSENSEIKLISVEYQGRPFNYYKHHGKADISFKQDIEGLLRSSGSFKPHANKGADPSNAAIGKFGLGFKCVYLITDSPVIHSGHWHFKINHTCIPEEIAPPENWSPKKTRIELPIKACDIPNDINDINVDSIWKLLPFLHLISEIKFVNNEETSLITRIEKPVQSIDDIEITDNVIIVNDFSECRYYKIRHQHAQLALLLDEKEKPLRWLSKFDNDCYSYLPLTSRLDFGFAVSNQFSIQSGRTHLLKDEGNTTRSDEIKQLVLPLLKYLIIMYADNIGFWEGFWEVFKFENISPETERIKRDIAESLTSSMQKLPIIPTMTSLVSRTDCNKIFYFSDEILSSVREVILESSISLNGVVINSENTAKIETISRLKAILELSEQDYDLLFVEVDVKTLINEFKSQPILAKIPEILNVIVEDTNPTHWHFNTDWLSECRVLIDGDEGFDFPANLYMPSIVDLEYLPKDKIQKISSHYNEKAIELLSDSGLKAQPDESELIDWISSKKLLLDQCIDLIRYLSRDHRYADFIDIKEGIQSEWIPYNGSFITPKLLIEQDSCFESLIADSVYCSWLGILSEHQQEQVFVDESKQIDTEAVLTKISKWWAKESERKIPEYNNIVYADDHGLENIGDPKESDECKSDWLKLLLLGSLHAMGRAKIEQHREYISKCIKSGMFNMGLSHKEREDRWLNSMLEIIDSPNDNQQYYHWIGFTWVRFFQFNRWLDDYISVFQDINKHKKSMPLETLRNPRSNPSYSGTGIEPPSLEKALSTVGMNFVLRELVRHEVIKNDVIYSKCFVPTRNIRNLFIELSNGTEFESSDEIMEFLSENMPDMDVTFGNCFDIPFLMILRDKELQHKLIDEDLDLSLEDEYDI
nr:sacsin [Candidatus Cloacimonadota bacterium]